MNLHGLASGYISAVNPLIPVSVQISTGISGIAPDGTPSPQYATPGSITASVGGTFTCTSSGTTLTVGTVLGGALWPGDAVSGSDGTNALPPGTAILSQITGTAGGVGTYLLNQAAAPGNLGPCTVTALSDVLTVSAISSGVLMPGQDLADSGALLAGTNITGQLTGATGGVGTYSLNQMQSAPVPSESMATSMTLLGQWQALSTRDLRQMEGLNLQGNLRALYVNGTLNGVVRVLLKGGDLIKLSDGTVWLVTMVPEPWGLTAGWSKVICTLQNGS